MAKNASYQSKLSLRTGTSPDVYQDVAQAGKIKPPAGKRAEIDVTTHDSTGAYREYLPSFKDPGEVSIDILFDQNQVSHGSGANGLYGLFNATGNPTRHWKITFANASPNGTLEFDAYVSGFEFGELTIDNAQMATVTFRVTGQPVLA